MHFLLVALILGLFIHDVMPRSAPQDWSIWAVLAVTLGAKILVAIIYGGAGRWARRRLQGGNPGGNPGENPGGVLRRLDHLAGMFHLVVFGLYVFDLALGLLTSLRENVVGDLILLDELLFLLPTLAMLFFAWWVYYPIDRLLRESTLIRRIDRGQPIYAIWSRWEYIIYRLRHEVALILVPLLLILAWHEAVIKYTPPSWQPGGFEVVPFLTMGGAATIFLCAPVIIRYLWDTVRLPEGEIRQRMMAMCRQHRVGVREVLLWRTAGGMINAAVMGLIAPLRFILLTDALLDQLSPQQLEAVMAHELAHVRRHHMFWLLAVAVVVLGLGELIFFVLFDGTLTFIWPDLASAHAEVTSGSVGEGVLSGYEQLLLVATNFCAVVVWGLAFGWVSRRAERQADTFAVVHLASQKQTVYQAWSGSPLCADGESVQAMVDALQQVADLNHVPVDKHNWRHGSIAWRQSYLRSLIGKPVTQLSIDRLMLAIKLVTLALMGLLATSFWLLG